MPVALILVDALSPSYILSGALPAVAQLAAGGMTCPLENIYAYRGIEATLFTGRAPAEHGVWGEFHPAAQPRSEGRSGRLLRRMVGLADVLPSDRLRLDVRHLAARLGGADHLPTGNLVPAGLMPHFEASVDSDIWAPGCLPVPTIFDEIRSGGGSFETVLYPVVRTDDEVVSRVKYRLLHGDLPDLWYIKFSALDALGHRYGPRPDRFRGVLKALNEQIAELTSALRRAYDANLDIVLLSDHGMSQVGRVIDVRPVLSRTGLRPGRDYLYFLDSTTIRLWSDSPANLQILASSFAHVPGISAIDAGERAHLGIPGRMSTGDLLLALEEGTVVFPDFFRASIAPLGMHGYAKVLSVAGLPYLAVGARMAVLLGYDAARGSLGHAAVWSAIRRRLGLGCTPARPQPAVPLAQAARLEEPVPCTY